MANRRIDTTGFEEALLSRMESHRFPSSILGFDLQLKVGYHLNVDDMPETDEIEASASNNGVVFNGKTHPCIAIYCEPVPGIGNSSSSGSRLEWLIRIVIRYGVSTYKARQLLENLYWTMIKTYGGKKVGKHLIRAVVPSSRPVGVFQEGDEHAFASAALRFLVVALP